ncbi:MAG TPA: hypothetical protein VM509_03035 [Planctomycetota bacterium]|nr:hypothetical protein [Planctomycetota bacterium]
MLQLSAFPRRSPWLASLLLLAALPVAAESPAAQKKNDPTTCPYCKGDPELMKKAGLVSHGGFEFGSNDTAGADTLLASSDIRWVESTHFQIGVALGTYKIKEEEKKAIRAELDRLALVLTEVDAKPKMLDPWIRVHLYAQRCEDVYARFCQIMQVKDSDFPSGTKLWDGRTKYMGEGPYLGQKGKYEVLLLPSEAAATTYMKEQYGVTTKKSQRWNVTVRDTLAFVAHVGDGKLKDDPAMHGHVAFNMAINMLDGLKHYSYDTPIWLREGLAHFMEREINPKFNSFDSSEGAIASMTNKEKWEPEVKKMIAADQQTRISQMMTLKDYGGLTLNHHFTVWSMTDYMIRARPNEYAAFNDKLHGRMNKQNFSDSSDMVDFHRTAFQEKFGMNYVEFEAAWMKWVEETYVVNPAKE